MAAAPLPAAVRRIVDLDAGWRFARGARQDDPSVSGFADDGWQRVDLPHVWNRIGSYEGQASDLYQGIGWYRRNFETPKHAPGERSVLQFDGASEIADVWLNGRKLGSHAGSFSRFRFDVTDLLRDGAPNVLAVRLDNSPRVAGSRTADVIPISGDFFIFGGLYRQVSLITTGAIHVDLLDHGGPGVTAVTSSADRRRAIVETVTRVRGPGGARLVVSLLDRSGRRVASTSREVREGDWASRLDIKTPHLWDGRRDPYLYTLRVSLVAGGQERDRVDLTYGVRSIRIDPTRGLFLNGRHLDLHGVSRHQDMLSKGWALTDADHARDMAMIEELGANTIRMAHYQHAPTWFDLADRDGMIVWAEIPYVNQAALGPQDPDPALVANAREQLTELIRQNQYRPGIVTWSVGNEIDLRATQEHRSGRSYGLLRTLADLARTLDPSRPTTFADCCEPTRGRPGTQPEALTGATTLIGYNRYLGWYSGRPSDLGPALDTLHARHPAQPLAVSEYGAGGAITQHSDDPRGGQPDNHGLIQPEEYQTWLIGQSWPQIAARPYLWASWVWNMFDFASPRREGDSNDLNTKGLVTADRTIRKDAFYYLQAQWSEAPMLHLAGRRYVDHAYPIVDVEAYTTADWASLHVGDRDLGEQPCPGRVCRWPGVHLSGGANRLRATATANGHELTDAIEWTAPDPAAGYGLVAGTLLGHAVPGGGSFGSDTFFSGGEARRAQDSGLAPPLGTSYREGVFRYTLPVPSGRWTLTLWLKRNEAGDFGVRVGDRAIETVAHGSGLDRRSMTVETHGNPVIVDFPPAAAAARLAALSIRPR